MAKTKDTKEITYKINFYQFLSKVFLAIINKGQLPAVFLFILFLVIIFRLPKEQLLDTFPYITDVFSKACLWGWLIAGALVISFVFIFKYIRQVHTAEIKRISDEKTYLQQQLLGKQNVKSTGR